MVVYYEKFRLVEYRRKTSKNAIDNKYYSNH